MEKQLHIEDLPLEPALDFKLLKEKALGIIQHFSGEEWSNYNPADPGITILDQLCYALTELAYCTDFPIEDILSETYDEIDYQNQFYKLDEVFTSAAITSQDFRKSLIHAIDGIDNAVITALPNKISPILGIYEVQLLLNDKFIQNSQAIQEQVFLYLNEKRSLGTVFLKPQLLVPKRVYMFGTLSITKLNDFGSQLKNIEEQIRNFIFPKVEAKGYTQLKNEGFEDAEIFEGPNLESAWITNKQLGEKKTEILAEQIHSCFTNSEVIQYFDQPALAENLSTISASNPLKKKKIETEPNEVIQFDVADDIQQNRLSILLNGRQLTAIEAKKLAQELSSNTTSKIESNVIQSALSSRPELPQGTSRNIEEYYSIQNTMPELYKVGEYAIQKEEAPYETALSRQLAAYLSLFDQLLANQFSQVAHLAELFSFKNQSSSNFIDQQNLQGQKKFTTPYSNFSPTYYFQSLYDVSNVQPLLQGVEEFGSLEGGSAQSQATTWKKFKGSPFNSYMQGLSNAVESRTEGLKRRNQMLNHLLARHGESPEFIDQLIKGSTLSGDATQDQIVFKSIYLQNFARINYHLPQAHSYLSAEKATAPKLKLSIQELQQLDGEKELDFVLRIAEIEKAKRLKKADFTSFSAFQIKLNLLLGLEEEYTAFMLQYYYKYQKQLDKVKALKEPQILYADWFKQRKGAIVLESSLLAALANYEVIIRVQEYEEMRYWRIHQYLSYEEFICFEQGLEETETLITALNEEQIEVNGTSYELIEIIEEEVADLAFQQLEETEIYLSYRANWGKHVVNQGNPLLDASLLILLPEFIERFQEQAFSDSLALLAEDSLPIYMEHQLLLLDHSVLIQLIPTYVQWHNSLLHQADASAKERMNQAKLCQQTTDDLVGMLLKLIPTKMNDDV